MAAFYLIIFTFTVISYNVCDISANQRCVGLASWSLPTANAIWRPVAEGKTVGRHLAVRPWTTFRVAAAAPSSGCARRHLAVDRPTTATIRFVVWYYMWSSCFLLSVSGVAAYATADLMDQLIKAQLCRFLTDIHVTHADWPWEWQFFLPKLLLQKMH